MPFKFDQRPLPSGVLHMLVDDGTTIRHVFSESARWSDVASAAAQGSSTYAKQFWSRRCVTDDDVAGMAGPVIAYADAAVVYALSDDGRTLSLVAHHGYSPDAVAGWSSLPASTDFPVTSAIRHGRPRFYRDADEMERAHPSLSGSTCEFYGSYLALPIGERGVALMAWRDVLDVRQDQLLEMLGAV